MKTYTPEQWSYIYGITILDPDGWRVDGSDYNKPITFFDFVNRANESTIDVISKARYRNFCLVSQVKATVSC